MSDTGPFYIAPPDKDGFQAAPVIPAIGSSPFAVPKPSETNTHLTVEDLPDDTVIRSVFNDKHKEDLEGLLYLGRLEHKFTWANHRFHIRTLTSGERLRVGEISKPYQGTSEETRAWIMAQAGLCVISVDSKPPWGPLGPSEDDADAAWAWVNRQYPWTVDAIFTHLLNLEARAQELVEEMGKASGSLTV